MLGALLLLGACSGVGPQSSLNPEGPSARDIDGLWNMVFSIAAVIFVLVNVGLIVSIVRFREKKGDTREPKQIHGNTKLEIAWTIAPALILAVLAVPTVRGIFDFHAEPDDPATIQVHVTGHQWWWELTYPGYVGPDGRELVTANELHIPADRPVYLTMSSSAVIHSFWVPPLNGKRDVVPGRITNLTLQADGAAITLDRGFGPGVILGQGAEFCGLAHADMRLRVFVHTPEDFEAWAQSQLEPAVVAADGPAAAGFETFNAVCTACHQATVAQPDGTVETVGPDNHLEVDGTEFRASYAPNLTHFADRTTFGSATFDNTAAHLAEWIEDPPAMKPMDPDRNDIPAGRILGMPDFGLSTEEIDNLVALLETWR